MVRWRTSAPIRWLSAHGSSPIRRYGRRTANGTCQETVICVLGSAPYARCRPNGATSEPSTSWPREVSTVGAAWAGDDVTSPVPTPAPAIAAVATEVRSTPRRVSRVRRYSCCSAMLMRSASFSGMPKRGMSMAGNVLSSDDANLTTG